MSREPYLKEPLRAPWWAPLYTFHHWLWCELHYREHGARHTFKRMQYDTQGNLLFGGLSILLAYVAVWLVMLVIRFLFQI